MPTTSGILSTAFKGLAIIGLGYAAKRLYSDKALRGKVMGQVKSAMSSLRGKPKNGAATGWSATARELARNDGATGLPSTDDVIANEVDATFPSFPPATPKGFSY